MAQRALDALEGLAIPALLQVAGDAHTTIRPRWPRSLPRQTRLFVASAPDFVLEAVAGQAWLGLEAILFSRDRPDRRSRHIIVRVPRKALRIRRVCVRVAVALARPEAACELRVAPRLLARGILMQALT